MTAKRSSATFQTLAASNPQNAPFQPRPTGRAVRTAFLALVVIVVLRMPAQSQEATVVGLKGPVHTVLTEEFNDADGAPNLMQRLSRLPPAPDVTLLDRRKPKPFSWPHTTPPLES